MTQVVEVQILALRQPGNMWSGKGANEFFLTFAWVGMVVICLLQIAGLLL